MNRGEILFSLSDEYLIAAAKRKSSFFKLANDLIDSKAYYRRNSDKAFEQYMENGGNENYWILSMEDSKKANTLQSNLERLKEFSKKYKSYWSDYVIADADMTSDIASRVRIIIADKFDVDKKEVVPETSFKIDLEADEYDFLELIIEFEKKFNIGIPDEQLGSIDTVWDAIKVIEDIMS